MKIAAEFVAAAVNCICSCSSSPAPSLSAIALGLRILKVGYAEARSLAMEFRRYKYLQTLLTSYHVWILSRTGGALALGIAKILLPLATKDDWR
jgi:hypothetical protein